MEYFSKGPKLRKGRSGAMPKNVSTVLKEDGDNTTKIPGTKKLSALQFHAFGEELRKIAAGTYNPASAANLSTGESGVPPTTVTNDEALEAASILDKRKRKPLVGPAKMGLVGSALAPTVGTAARGFKGFIDTSGGLRRRLTGAGKEMANVTKGTLASQALAGGLTSASLQQARQELTESAAERRVNQFLKERGAV